MHTVYITKAEKRLVRNPSKLECKSNYGNVWAYDLAKLEIHLN